MSEENATAPAENTNEAAAGATEQTAPAEQPASQPEQTLIQQATAPDESQTGEEPSEAQAQENERADKPEESEAKTTAEEGAPEKYEAFTAPEGMRLDDAVAGRFAEVAKDLGLSQSKAQGVIDTMLPIIANSNLELVRQANAEFISRSKASDEVMNGMRDIARLRDKFAKNPDGSWDPDIKEVMDGPMGNHPGILKLLARAGKAFGEASFPTGSPAPRQYTADDVYRKR